jgi:hypothetical protein
MWGVIVGGNVPWSPYIYLAIGLMLGFAGFGLWKLWRLDKTSRRWLLLMGVHLSIVFILPLIDFFMNRRLGKTAQGRHIFIPAAAALAGLIGWGLTTALPQRWRRWLFPVIVISLIGWTVGHIQRLATFDPALLPLRTIPQAAEWLPDMVEAQFGEAIELVSYELDPQLDQGLVRMTLAFRSLAYVNQNYLLSLKLVDSQGKIVSHWTGYNGHGRLPTLAWDPGDVVFDRLALPLPNLAAGDYTLEIQLLTGQMTASLDRLVSLPLTLDEPATLILDETKSIDGLIYNLWRADGPTPGARPTYRYPATISIVTDAPRSVELLGPLGQAWSPTYGEANIYNFIIGPRWPSGEYRLQIISEQGDQKVSEALLFVENWWPRHFAVPDAIEVPTQANFANQFEFLGYTLPQKKVQAGEAFPLTLYWQVPPDKSPEAHFIQFNNLLDSSGTVYGGYERLPLEYYSTLLWTPGEIVVDGYTVPVKAGAPPGQYYLDVGYYLIVGQSAVNLPLVVEGQMTDVSSVTIGPIEVVSP